MAQGSRRGGSFEIGHVFSRGFEVLGANALPFFAVSLFLSAPSALMLQFWQTKQQQALRNGPEAVLTWDYWGPLLAIILFSTVIGAILQAALSGAAVAYLEDEETSFTDHLFDGLKLVPALVVIAILSLIAMCLAAVLLIFPAIMLAMAWAVLYPVYVREQPGIFGAFARSAELTAGYRWPVFAILLVAGIAVLIVQYVLGMLIGVIAPSSEIVDVISSAIGAAINSTVTTCIVASIYVDLRDMKEGAPDTLERIFN